MKKIAILPLLLVMFIGLNAQDSEGLGYGNNLISFSPFSAYGSDDIGDVFITLGYERFIKENISISTFAGIGLSDEGYQFGFGPKVYPAGHDKPVSFGITPMFIYTSSISQNQFGFYDPIIGSYPSYPNGVRVNQFGFVILPSLNVTIDSNLYLGIEGGLGYNYVNNYDVDVDPGYQQDPSVSGMFRCNLGYRF